MPPDESNQGGDICSPYEYMPLMELNSMFLPLMKKALMGFIGVGLGDMIKFSVLSLFFSGRKL
jgi:hypothetical protein